MTHTTRRYIAGPIFILLFALGLPALVAGRLSWFVGDWTGTIYVTLFGLGIVAMLSVWFDPSAQTSERKLDFGHFFIVVGFLASLVAGVYEHTRGTPLMEWKGWSWIGLIVCMFGAAVAFWSYYPRRLVTPGEQGKIMIAQGIYRYLRFPAYSSLLLWGVGLSLTLPSLWSLIPVLFLLFLGIAIRIQIEEKRLLQAFGEEFSSYQQHSRRLIPFVF